jgi:hypothetical protein
MDYPRMDDSMSLKNVPMLTASSQAGDKLSGVNESQLVMSYEQSAPKYSQSELLISSSESGREQEEIKMGHEV